MSDLVGNPEDGFSHNEAQLFITLLQIQSEHNWLGLWMAITVVMATSVAVSQQPL